MLVVLAGPAAAAPGEPLIVTPLGNPDPGLVAAPEPQLMLTKLHSGDDRDSAVEEAIERFGRAIGQASRADQQAIEARCRSSQASASSADRFAWAATCQYVRH
jgi:hypothetical protein